MTYEQSKYMNGDETANAPHSPDLAKQAEQGRKEYFTNKWKSLPSNGVEQTPEVKEPNFEVFKNQVQQNKQDKQTSLENMQTGAVSAIGTQPKAEEGEETSEETTKSYLPETMGDKEQDLYQNVASNDVDSDTKLQEQGQGKKEAIESVVPRYDKKTWVGLMTDPNMTWDQKAELIMNGLGGALSAADTGQVQQTDKRAINDTITQQYAENIADRDKRAMNAQIEPLEALNKQQTDVELRLRDTPVSAYIDRYNAEQSAETKKQVLEALIKDKGTWSRLSDRQKMDTLSYIQALDGNGSLLGMALQEFGPDVLEWLKSITKGNGEESGDTSPTPTTRNFTTVGAYEIPDDVLTNPDLKEDYVAIPVGGNKPPLVVRRGTSYGVVGPVTNADAKRYDEEVEAAFNAIMGNDALTPEQKIAMARDVDGLTGKNELVFQAKDGVERKVRAALGVGDTGKPKPDVSPADEKTRKDNAHTVQTEINNIQSLVTSGNMTPSDAVKKIDALAPKMENMEDGTGLIALKAQNLMRDYVMQDIKDYTESNAIVPLKNATASLQGLERMVKQYADKIAQDPKLSEEVNNLYTKYRYQENYIDPFMRNVGQDVLKTGGNSVGGVEMPSGSWVIGSDGQIWDKSPYNLSGKSTPIDFATYQWDTNKNAKASAITALTRVYDKANPETVKKNMGSVPIEGQGEVFRESPIYKFMENLVKDENFKNKAYAVNRSGAFVHPDMKSMYDKINGRYLMWKNK